MSELILITTLLLTAGPAPNVGEALDEFEDGNYIRAALLLDDLARTEPTQYQSNNLHYVRGRIAEAQQEWARAEREFNQVGADSVLYELAVWHLARIALLDDRPSVARTRMGWLPAGFPEDLLADLASLAPPALALEIYDRLSTREARLEGALIRGDRSTLWSLLRERSNDDVAVRAAGGLYDPANLDISPGDRLFLARSYASHRTFERAEPLYISLLEDPDHGADAHYGLGRIYFQLTRYEEALGLFRATILNFPNTSQARDAELQIPSTYWRMLDFETAAVAYLDLIDQQGPGHGSYQSSVRDLVDIYRALDDTENALSWIDRGLRNGPSASERAVLTFTRAKIEYLRGDYEAAVRSFRQVAGMTLRSVPNGTDREEVRFMEALSLEKLGRLDEAHAIWTNLAQTPFSYYGLKSAEKLGNPDSRGGALNKVVRSTLDAPPNEQCRRSSEDTVRSMVRSRRLAGTRQLLEEGLETNRVGELVFLHVWDEAFYWASQQADRHDNQTLADLAYLAGDYRRAMLYADRVRSMSVDDLFDREAEVEIETEVLVDMLYPAGFADYLCSESVNAGTNPLWLRSIIWQESRYDRRARSGAVARGLMQFIPETAIDVGRQIGLSELDVTRSLYDPAVSVKLGAYYWSFLIEDLDHPEMALAAYNGGPLNVLRWQAKSNGRDPEVFVSDIGFVETKNYVRRVFELYARYAYLQQAN